jgi:hypothetical protein
MSTTQEHLEARLLAKPVAPMVEITMRINSYVLVFGVPAMLTVIILGTMATCRFLVFPTTPPAPIQVQAAPVTVTPQVTAVLPKDGIQVRVTVPEIVVPPAEVTVQEVIHEKAVVSPVTVTAKLDMPPGIIGAALKLPDMIRVVVTEMPKEAIRVTVKEELDSAPKPPSAKLPAPK